MNTLRPGLEEPPKKMRHLPIDDRGYPVPWFVAYVKGKPEFRCADSGKLQQAITVKRCWICGNKLHKPYVFVSGPMCGVNRTSAEPPSHLECAQYAVRNCPFLNDPRMTRREDDYTDALDNRPGGPSPGIGLKRNPGVTLLWICRTYDIFSDRRGGKLISMGEPDRVEWYREGRLATLAEVRESIDTGLPALEALAKTEPGSMEALQRAVARFDRYLPPPVSAEHSA